MGTRNRLAGIAAAVAMAFAACAWAGAVAVQGEIVAVRTGLVVERVSTKATVTGDLAQFEMKLAAESHDKGVQHVRVFEGQVAITEWSVAKPLFGAEAHLRRMGGGVDLVVQGKGKYVLKVSFVGRVKKARLGRTVTVPLVQALAAVTELTVPGKELEFKAEPEMDMETVAVGERTMVRMYGGEGSVAVRWFAKAPEKVLKPVVFADQFMRVRIGQGIMRIDSTIDYAIVQGGVSELAVRFPADCSLLNIEGADIRTWDVSAAGTAGARVLKVALLTEVKKSYALRLRMEKVLPKIKMDTVLPVVEPLQVIREKGQVAVSAARGISVEAVSLENISHVDVREMGATRGPGDVREEVRLGFRYLKRPFALSLRTGEVVAKTSAEILTLVRAGLDTLRLTATINYTIRDAGVFQFRVHLEKGLRLIDISGRNINNWQFDEKERVLTVALRAKAEGAYSLQIETEQERGRAGETVTIPTVRALDVDRETGYLAVLPAPTIKVETASVKGISQIDVKELPAALLRQSPALAYRHIRPAYAVAINVSEIQPEVQAEVRTLATLDEHEMSLDTEIHYDIRRAGIFQLRVAIPKSLRRTRTEGNDIDDSSWDEQSGVLTVNLRSKVTGKYVLKLGTERTVEALEKGVDVPVIRAEGVKKEHGFIGVITKASVRLKPGKGKMEGLDDVSVGDLPPEMLRRSGKIALAFKYFSQPWRLGLAVERIEPRVTAEVFNLLAIGEKIVTVSATLKYKILHAGVDAFTIKLPLEASAVDIDGDGIKHREEDKKKGTRTVILQSKRTDTYTLYVNFQQTVDKEQTYISYPGVQALGVQRETGYLAIASRPDVELTVRDEDIENLTPIDSREVPQSYLRGVTLPILLAYRYVLHPYVIRVGALPHEAAEVTVAVIEAARFSTTITEEGNLLTDMVCRLRNSRQQYLDLRLPEKSRILHTFVDGKAVTPWQDGETTKIEVVRANNRNAPFEVRIRYSDERAGLGRAGAIRLEAPVKDIDIMRLAWTLSMPEGYDLVRTEGTLKRIRGSHVMERYLRDLNPDAEVRVQPGRVKRMGQSAPVGRQEEYNVNAMVQIDIQGKGQPNRSIYTGAKPVQRNNFAFQGLLISSKKAPWLRASYLKGSVGIPLQGLVALLVLGGCGLVWRRRAMGRMKRVGVFVALALIVLAVRTLAEEAYRSYLTMVMWTLGAVAVVMLGYSFAAWIREAVAARCARKAAKATAVPAQKIDIDMAPGKGEEHGESGEE